MDISLNTLDFLISSGHKERMMKKTTNETNTDFKRELIFYRKRIFQLTKDLLKLKKINNSDVQDSFNNFVVDCIGYLKFEDKKDILQSEYDDLEASVSKSLSIEDVELEDANSLIMNMPEPKINTIEDAMNIKVKRENKKEVKVIPQQKKIDLKDKTLRTKGVKKKDKKKKINKEIKQDITHK